MNIAVFLDGTWNTRKTRTNVLRLHNRVAHADAGGERQLKYYDEGVGTKPGERIRGGVFAFGLSANVMEAYRFITTLYGARPGATPDEQVDRIHICGFSRGAYTARSLAGMIAYCGLVPAEDLGTRRVFERYRRAKEDARGLNEMRLGLASAETDEDRLVRDRSRLARIRTLAVFDTVGSVGIPSGLLRSFNRWRWGWHNTILTGLVDFAAHAVAVSEYRKDFRPTLWQAPDKPIPGRPTRIDQLWYTGSHGNVGGGGEDPSPLSAITEEWIAERLHAGGLTLDPPPHPPAGDEWGAEPSDSYGAFMGGLYRYLPWRHHVRPVRPDGVSGLSPSVRRRWRERGRKAFDPMNPGLAEWLADEDPDA